MYHINTTTTGRYYFQCYYYYYYHHHHHIIINFLQGIYNYTLYITHEINHASTVNNVSAIQ